MTGRLNGKVAVITGAASGIGHATVELFVREGAKVIAADIQDDKGARLEEAHGASVHYVHCNVMEEVQIKAAVDAATAKFGRLDCIFNNAGSGGALDPIEAISAESFADVMNLHVRAALWGMKYAVPVMRAAGGGSIISTGSIAGLRSGYGPILYSTAKGAVIHMTRVAAAMLGADKIRVNCICPGGIATPIFAKAAGMATQVADTTVAAVAEALKQIQPLPIAGQPEDIAEGAAYLASDGAKFVSGHALIIDGGITVGEFRQGEGAAFAGVLQAVGVDPAAMQAVLASLSAQPH
ncbi:MAG: glucose 1-dehydrogenase [Alphaproteobacteria bacterium]|nr:glucose 1-dehydrogenase [Alphaproteobacteria bacterium]